MGYTIERRESPRRRILKRNGWQYEARGLVRWVVSLNGEYVHTFSHLRVAKRYVAKHEVKSP